MRVPLRAKSTPRSQVTTMKSLPPPVGGWNARDALASMPATDAVALENWFPSTSYVKFRGGSASHATGMTDTGKTLMPYNALSASNTFYAATASGIYNVSSAGAVGAAVLARTNGKHQHVMFGDGTYNWLIAVNGVDKPAYFDGTTWTAVDGATTPALTGVTTTSIVGVNAFKGRLFFILNNSLSFWYLAAGAAGGALTEFNLAGECPKGGYLVAMATWTRDAGDGADDVAVFITSEGNAVVYQGTNPSSATTWAKIGSFSIPRPLGRRCIEKFGGDCVLIAEDGVYPLAAILQSGDPERGKYALSYKIQDAVTTAARSYGTNFGWRATIYPAQNALIVNIPIAENGTHEQYVMNTITKAWCKFTGWNAEDFAVFNGELYFCSGAAVYKAWTGTADLTSDIIFYAKQAFQDFRDPRKKKVKLYMPLLAVNGNVQYGADIDVDFGDDAMTGVITYSPTARSLWGTALWGSGTWSSGLEMTKQWSSPDEWEGRWIAGKIKISSGDLVVQWMGSSLMYEAGGSL